MNKQYTKVDKKAKHHQPRELPRKQEKTNTKRLYKTSDTCSFTPIQPLSNTIPSRPSSPSSSMPTHSFIHSLIKALPHASPSTHPPKRAHLNILHITNPQRNIRREQRKKQRNMWYSEDSNEAKHPLSLFFCARP